MSRVLGTYALRHPIVRDTRDASGQVHEEMLREAGHSVTLKRPRAKDLRVMDRFDGQEIGGSMALLAKVSSLSDEEVELLDAEDLGELGNLLGESAPGGRKTGETA